MNPQTENGYYIVEQGQKKGPVSLSALQTMRQQGTLIESSLVWRDGMTDWQPAASLLPQLFPAGQAPTELYVATAGQRILVGLIDLCILWLPVQMIILPVAAATLGAGFLLQLTYPIVNAVYGGIIIGSSWQASVGMKLLGLKVVDYSGRKPSPGQCWGRALGSILSWCVLGIGNLLVFFTPRHQALHDLMAGTLVVKSNRK